MSDRPADWRTRWAARLGAVAVWLLARTWRVRLVHDGEVAEARGRRVPLVYVVWHGQLLPALWAHRGQGISLLISEHRDGELIARVAQAFGYRTVRGSTTRGANRALVGLVRELEAGVSVAITPDGPTGPYHRFAAGALLVAQRSARPIVPTGVHVSRFWQFGSWDRFVLPKPFARVTIAFGPFLSAPAGAPKELAELTDRYRDAIDHAVAAAAGAPRGARA